MSYYKNRCLQNTITSVIGGSSNKKRGALMNEISDPVFGVEETLRLKQRNEILEKKLAEFSKSDEQLRADMKKLSGENESLRLQLKRVSEREIEHRTRAEISEELVEKFFDKMLEKMH